MSIKDGKYVLTQKGCPHCESWKDDNKSLMSSGEIKEQKLDNLKEDSPWWGLMDNLGIEGTPSVVEIKGDKACEIDFMKPTSAPRKCFNMGSVQDLINSRRPKKTWYVKFLMLLVWI